MKTFSIDVCGVPYTCIIGSREEIPIGESNQGECNVYSKKILVCSDLDKSFEEDDCRRQYLTEVIRHEVSHAILYESGMCSLADGEEMPEWLSVNVPKIEKCVEDFAAFSLGVLFDKNE